MTDDSRALSAQETNVGAPHGAIRARQGEDDAAAVTTKSSVERLEPFLMEGHRIYVDGLRGQLLSPEQQDWEYRSLPWVTVEAWDRLFGIIGETNIHMVSGSEVNRNGVVSRRASFFLSPAGMENMKQWSASRATALNQGNAESPSSSDLNATGGTTPTTEK